jgi:hypothetical protein
MKLQAGDWAFVVYDLQQRDPALLAHHRTQGDLRAMVPADAYGFDNLGDGEHVSAAAADADGRQPQPQAAPGASGSDMKGAGELGPAAADQLRVQQRAEQWAEQEERQEEQREKEEAVAATAALPTAGSGGLKRPSIVMPGLILGGSGQAESQEGSYGVNALEEQ